MSAHKKGDYIWRKSKAEASGVLVLTMRTQFEHICQLALEGKFAQEGLIDKNILFDSLNSFRHGKTDQLWPLLNLLVAETWLKHWNV